MAIQSIQLDSVMIPRFQTGVGTGGAPVLRQKSIPVKASATDQDIADITAALFSLSQYPMITLQRNNCFSLEEE